MSGRRTDAFGPGGWTPDRLPDLAGKTYVITGANSGIGYEAARLLGAKGAAVTLVCRGEDKAEAAVAGLQLRAKRAAFDYVVMDLADLASIGEAAEKIRSKHAKIDALINNAGIMMTPTRTLTKDGFETQLGVNHLGQFAFAAALSDLVEAASGRFVTVASLMHNHAAHLRFDDFLHERGYTPTGAYAQSKLANLVFALELNRRLAAAGAKSRSYACHPGYSATNLQSSGPSQLMAMVMKPATALFAQPAAKGAIPTVLCAAGKEAEPGGYYGPTGFSEMTGPVGPAKIARQARDEAAGTRLWEISEMLTGAKWPILTKAQAA